MKKLIAAMFLALFVFASAPVVLHADDAAAASDAAPKKAKHMKHKKAKHMKHKKKAADAGAADGAAK